MGQVKWLVGLATVALFVIALLSLTGSFADNNTVFIDGEDDSILNSSNTKIKGNLTSFSGAANATMVGLEDTSTGVTDTFQKISSFTGGAKQMLNSLNTALSLVWKRLFGGDTSYGLFLTVLAWVIGLIGALYFYKTLRGNPD